MRYAGVVDEEVMDKIKNAVPNKSSDRQPIVSFEAKHGKQQKAACNDDFNDFGRVVAFL
jgi:hypothetical protein